jgi:tRNA G18 (ribose-2'-O)-methylase SpoU
MENEKWIPYSEQTMANGKRQLILIVHNVRSTHNAGSLLRTAEGLGVEKVYLTGYTPYPLAAHDSRLPHLTAKIHKQIQKTALGAETTQAWEHAEDITAVIAKLRTDGFTITAIEQAENSTPLPDYEVPAKIALIVGREVEGIEPEVVSLCDLTLEIPMFGQKESFNVAQAAAMALYHCRFAA